MPVRRTYLWGPSRPHFGAFPALQLRTNPSFFILLLTDLHLIVKNSRNPYSPSGTWTLSKVVFPTLKYPQVLPTQKPLNPHERKPLGVIPQPQIVNPVLSQPVSRKLTPPAPGPYSWGAFISLTKHTVTGALRSTLKWFQPQHYGPQYPTSEQTSCAGAARYLSGPRGRIQVPGLGGFRVYPTV